jgi:hypothetical protein
VTSPAMLNARGCRPIDPTALRPRQPALALPQVADNTTKRYLVAICGERVKPARLHTSVSIFKEVVRSVVVVGSQ